MTKHVINGSSGRQIILSEEELNDVVAYYNKLVLERQGEYDKPFIVTSRVMTNKEIGIPPNGLEIPKMYR